MAVSKSSLEAQFDAYWNILAGDYPRLAEEIQFDDERKWRIDRGLPELKIGIEIEGVGGNKSRHLTMKGYSEDCTKYNRAAELGWVILRYTTLHIENDPMSMIEQIKSVINRRKSIG